MKRVFAVAGLALLLGACADGENPVAPPAVAAPDTPLMNIGTEPGASILLVHGLDVSNFGHDCAAVWSKQRDALRAYGHTGRIQTVGYYNANRNCDRNVHSTVYTKQYAGDWRAVRGEDNGLNGILDNNTPIEHAAYRVAWAIVKENAENGSASVRVVAHSLGGLVVRHAIQQASIGNWYFPTLSQMNLTRVWTLGTPHLGTNYAYLGGAYQITQMRPGSFFLNGLNGDPRVGSATWFGFTSRYTLTGDGVVENNSACWARATWCGRHYLSIQGNGYAARGAYAHGDFMKDPNLSYNLANYDAHSPLNGTTWGARFYDVGATGMIARNLARN